MSARHSTPDEVRSSWGSMTELSHTLWRQRRLIEQLMYRLEVQQLVLAAGRTRWIDASSRDVERVMEEVRKEELSRAVNVMRVARALGLEGEPTLTDIIGAAPAPWDEILRDHQTAFMTMATEVDGLTRNNRELLNRGYQATRDFMAALDGVDAEPDAYSSAGTVTRRRPVAHTVDRSV